MSSNEILKWISENPLVVFVIILVIGLSVEAYKLYCLGKLAGVIG